MKLSAPRPEMLPGRSTFLLPGRTSLSHVLSPGEVYLVRGETRLHCISGKAEIAGAVLSAGEMLTVPRFKRLPLEIIEKSVLKAALRTGGEIERVPRRTIPADWDRFVERVLAEKRRRILIFGEVATGKTFLATYLANRLVAAGRKAAVLDGDTGQSAIGPPATIGLALLARPAAFLQEAAPPRLYFTGAYSPGSSLLEYATGLAYLLRLIPPAADSLIINTPGWVQGDGGRLLCRSEREIIDPDTVVLLQKERELRYIEQGLPSRQVFMLSVPERVAPTSSEERRFLREERMRAYFADAKVHSFGFSSLATDRCYFLTGIRQPVRAINRVLRGRPALWAELLGEREGILIGSRRELSYEEQQRLRRRFSVPRVRYFLTGDMENLLVALLGEDREVLALGAIERIDLAARKFFIRSPLPLAARKRVAVVQFGLVRISPAGREMGAAAPGSF